MGHKLKICAGALLGSAVALGLSVPAIAGMDNGDSSMNPFTGDSYAYFHGARNAGEQAMIIPGRTPAAQRSFERRFAQDRQEARFRPLEPSPADSNAIAATGNEKSPASSDVHRLSR